MSLLSTRTEPLIYDITKIYVEDFDAVKLNDFVFVNDDFELDIQMINNYGEELGLYYLPLILMFNGLDNVTDVNTLVVFKFPNIESLLDNISTLTDDDFNVGAVDNFVNKNNKSIGDVKPPSTKLNLVMPSVSYDSENGTITY
uniref:Uncharacterized protein n=1 Tax=Flavobacterium phage FKj-2 TaxID=908821 RepID=E3Q0T9_9VIRU|nr:hypothetical protein [Flavobacterium phage FKj-2]